MTIASGRALPPATPRTTGPAALRARPDRWFVAVVAVTAAAVAAHVAGLPMDTADATVIACLALLVFGLPHGTLDLALLRPGPDRQNARPLRVLLLMYGGCAGVMYLLWVAAPGLALLVFLAVAAVHFAEDWRDTGSAFLAQGIGIAVLATPALAHRDALSSVFTALAGAAVSVRLADALLLVAPVALAVALVGMAALWQAGERARAAGLGCALAAELLLPPVIGFAIFFCLVHSPYALRHGLAELRRPRSRVWRSVIAPLTLAALGIATAIGLRVSPPTLEAGMLTASFVTLSVLTIPHMLVPRLARL